MAYVGSPSGPSVYCTATGTLKNAKLASNVRSCPWQKPVFVTSKEGFQSPTRNLNPAPLDPKPLNPEP